MLLTRERQTTDDTAQQVAIITEILRAAQITHQGDPSGIRMTVLASRTADSAVLLAEQLPNALRLGPPAP